jgi:Tfp pilus assembly protein PilF
MMDAEHDRWMQLAARQLAMGNPSGAIEPLRRILADDPDVAEAHSFMALALLDLRRIHAALHEAGVGVSLAPEDPLAHRALGAVLLSHRKLSLANEHLERAIDLEPTDSHAHCILASLRTLQGHREEAGALLEKALALDPDSPAILADLGMHHLTGGAVAEAERQADEALSLEPEHRDALVLKGHVLLRRGEVEEAREHALWALRQGADSTAPLGLLASVKARESVFLGLWWRYNVWMGGLGERRAIYVVLGSFVVYRVLALGLNDLGQAWLASALQLVWLAFCAYTWIGPSRFRKALERELGQVQLDRDF